MITINSVIKSSLGDSKSRAAYRSALIDYLEKFGDQLSDDSKWLAESYVLKIILFVVIIGTYLLFATSSNLETSASDDTIIEADDGFDFLRDRNDAPE